jgi:integrase
VKGHTRQRPNGKWGYWIDVGRDPATGRRQQKTKAGFRTEKEAQQAMRQALRALDDGQPFLEPSRKMVKAYAREDWLPLVKATTRPSTAASYASMLQLHLFPTLGAVPLRELTAARLTSLYTRLQSSGRKDGRKGGLSPRSVRYLHAIVRRMLGDAVRQRHLAHNVALDAIPPRAKDTKPPRPATWDAGELRAFLAHVEDDRLFAAWRLLALTGCRRGECLALAWDDVDITAGTVTIRRTLARDLSVGPPKSDAGRRTIGVDERTMEALLQHQRRQYDDRAAFGADWPETVPLHALDGSEVALDLVFRREDGSPIQPNALTLAFRRHVEKAKLRPLRLHGLRHSHGTLADANGEQASVISRRLGHSSVAFTIATYVHPRLEDDAKAAQRTASLIDESAEVALAEPLAEAV